MPMCRVTLRGERSRNGEPGGEYHEQRCSAVHVDSQRDLAGPPNGSRL